MTNIVLHQLVALLRTVLRHTGVLPRVANGRQEDKGNRPVLDGCTDVDVALSVPLPDEGDDFDWTGTSTSDALDHPTPPLAVPIVLDNVTEVDQVSSHFAAPRSASNSPAYTPSACASAIATSDDCLVHHTDLEGRVPVGDVSLGTPSSSMPTSARRPRMNAPMAVAPVLLRSSARLVTSSPLPPRPMRLRSLSMTAADSPDVYRRDDAIAKFTASVPRKAPAPSTSSTPRPVYRQRRSRSVDKCDTRRAGRSSSASNPPPRRRSSSVSGLRHRDARDIVLYTPEIPVFPDGPASASLVVPGRL